MSKEKKPVLMFFCQTPPEASTSIASALRVIRVIRVRHKALRERRKTCSFVLLSKKDKPVLLFFCQRKRSLFFCSSVKERKTCSSVKKTNKEKYQ